jgi:hypothetical protein
MKGDLRMIIFVVLALLTLAFCMALSGCVRTVAKTPNGIEFSRTAVLYPFKTGGVEYNPDTGSITILDYNTDGGTQTAEKMAEGFARGAIEGAKP